MSVYLYYYMRVFILICMSEHLIIYIYKCLHI